MVSLLAASIMQRMAPHCSFARWLLCNGRYSTVTDLGRDILYVLHPCCVMCVYTHVVAFLASLFRFKHPSEGELCALAGKQIPKPNRRDRWERRGGV